MAEGPPKDILATPETVRRIALVADSLSGFGQIEEDKTQSALFRINNSTELQIFKALPGSDFLERVDEEDFERESFFGIIVCEAKGKIEAITSYTIENFTSIRKYEEFEPNVSKLRAFWFRVKFKALRSQRRKFLEPDPNPERTIAFLRRYIENIFIEDQLGVNEVPEVEAQELLANLTSINPVSQHEDGL